MTEFILRQDQGNIERKGCVSPLSATYEALCVKGDVCTIINRDVPDTANGACAIVTGDNHTCISLNTFICGYRVFCMIIILVM